jgi:prophage regulatory protein
MTTIIRINELAQRLGVSKSTLWRWRKAQIVPHPLSLGPRMVGWRATEIEAWLENVQKRGGIFRHQTPLTVGAISGV